MTKQPERGRDEQIERQVSAALKKEMQLSAMDIHVDSHDGTVLLSGVCDTLAEKAFAEKVANQVTGVRKVENNLTISTDGTLTDDEIQAHIEQHLREGQFAENLKRVGVKVEGGSAVLMGKVNTLSDKTNAVKEAQKAAGVKDVVSKIQIIPENADGEAIEFTDDKITSKITQTFSTSGISIPDIEVSTENGEVTLRGHVDDRHMMEIAEELAMDIEGVKKINNLLQLREDQR